MLQEVIALHCIYYSLDPSSKLHTLKAHNCGQAHSLSRAHHLLRAKHTPFRRLHHPLRLMQLSTRFAPCEARLTHSTLPLAHTPRRRRTMCPGSPVLNPIIPAPRILANIRISCLPRDARSSLTPHTCFAEENHLLADRWLCEAKLILELSGREEQRVRGGSYGQVDRGGDAVCAVFVGFADVD